MKASDFDFVMNDLTFTLDGRNMCFTAEYAADRTNQEMHAGVLKARRYVETQYPHRFFAVMYFDSVGCQAVETGYTLPSEDDLVALQKFKEIDSIVSQPRHEILRMMPETFHFHDGLMN